MDLEDNHEGIDNTEAQCYAGTDDADSNVNQASTSCTKDDAETSSSGKPKKSRVRRRKRELFKNIRDQVSGIEWQMTLLYLPFRVSFSR